MEELNVNSRNSYEKNYNKYMENETTKNKMEKEIQESVSHIDEYEKEIMSFSKLRESKLKNTSKERFKMLKQKSESDYVNSIKDLEEKEKKQSDVKKLTLQNKNEIYDKLSNVKKRLNDSDDSKLMEEDRIIRKINFYREKYRNIISDKYNLEMCEESVSEVYKESPKLIVDKTLKSMKNKELIYFADKMISQPLKPIFKINMSWISSAFGMMAKFLLAMVSVIGKIIVPPFLPLKGCLAWWAILALIFIFLGNSILSVAASGLNIILTIAFVIVLIGALVSVGMYIFKLMYKRQFTVAYELVYDTDYILELIANYENSDLNNEYEEDFEVKKQNIINNLKEEENRYKLELDSTDKKIKELEDNLKNINTSKKNVIENYHKNIKLLKYEEILNEVKSKEEENLKIADSENEKLIRKKITNLESSIKNKQLQIRKMGDECKKSVANCNEIIKRWNGMAEQRTIKDFCIDDAYVYYFPSEVTDDDKIAKIRYLEHDFNPMLMLYSKSMNSKSGSIEENIFELIGSIIKRYMVVNNIKYYNTTLIDCEKGGAYYIDDKIIQALISGKKVKVCENSSQINELMKTIHAERKRVLHGNIADINKKRYEEKEDAPVPYQIIFIYSTKEILKNDDFKKLLSNAKEYGILPIIFMEKEELRIDESNEKFMNQISLSGQSYMVNFSKEYKDEDFIVKTEIKQLINEYQEKVKKNSKL